MVKVQSEKRASVPLEDSAPEKLRLSSEYSKSKLRDVLADEDRGGLLARCVDGSCQEGEEGHGPRVWEEEDEADDQARKNITCTDILSSLWSS